MIHGHNPYPPADADLSDGTNNIWPIAAVLPMAPLTLVPPAAADWIATVLALGSLAAALLVLGVRDWRVYGVTLLWAPVVSAYQTANATLPLCLLCALAWRYRDHRWRPGLMLGIALAVKFFLWPLVVWLAALRQWRASLLSIVFATASLLLIVPFTPITSYFRLLQNLSNTFDDRELHGVRASRRQRRALIRGAGGHDRAGSRSRRPVPGDFARWRLPSAQRSSSPRSCGCISSRCSSSRLRSHVLATAPRGSWRCRSGSCPERQTGICGK